MAGLDLIVWNEFVLKSLYFEDDSILSALTLLRSYAYFIRILQGRIKYSLYSQLSECLFPAIYWI